MKRFLQSVLLSALLFCGLNLRAQVSAPDVRVERGDNYELVKVLDDNNWPYDISNNKKHVVIQGFGAMGGYYWSEETGTLTIKGFPFAVSDSGDVAGYYENNLGVNEAGLWSPKTKKWEFLGMNPDVPEYLQESTDYNGAWSMTNDGSKIGVMQFLSAMSTVTYVWDKENGYKKLDNGKSPQTRPNAISEDGRVVAGFAAHEDKGEWTPCYWVDGKIYRMPHLFGEALNVSPNGDYICGALLNHHAFVYDIKNEKLVEIENTLEPMNRLSATCVTNNGTVFGYSDGGAPTFRTAVAFVGGELMSFNTYLELNGVLDAANWTIYSINNITEDGKTFIGAGVIEGEKCTFVLTIDGAACDAPKNLTYTIEQPNYDDLVLSWDAPENAENVTYNIYTSYSEAPFAEGITETSFSFPDMVPGEYQFMVRANFNNGECISDISNVVLPTIYPCAENDKCELEIVKWDYFGDGWDHAFISIVGTQSEIVYTAKLSEGGGIFDSVNPSYLNGDTTVLHLCPDTYQFTWNPGNWDEECAFAILFNGEELYRKNYEEIDTIFKKKPMFFEYEINCENEDNTDDEDDNTDEEDDNTGDEEDNTDGIEEITSSFTITPNPAQDYFFVEGQNIASVEVFNAVGQSVDKLEVHNNIIKINTSKYNDGIYFVKVLNLDNEMGIKKIVVSK